MRFLLAVMMCLGMSLPGHTDPGDTWPWGAEIPFPWKGIQGTWSVHIGDHLIYFSFRTVQSSNGSNQLEVIEYQGGSCQVLAHGGGFEEERVVRGMILDGKNAKNITIHVFSESALKYGRDEALSFRKSKTYTVLNISGLNDENTEVYELHKVHNNPTGICPKKKR
jgi:hypothetical protein